MFDKTGSFAAAPDVFPPDRFNAGVLIIKPNLEVFQKLKEATQSLTSYDGGDTGT
jgi:glycogenin glucosyltransferase